MSETTFVPEQFHAAEGRMVVLQIAEGQYRPATIVKCWGDPDDPKVVVNLIVFIDGSNDATGLSNRSTDGHTAWATSVVQGPAVGQWLPRSPR